MENFRLDIFIVFALLGKNDNFKNGYSLTRALHWKFGMLNDLAVKEEMIKAGLITKNNTSSMNVYDITPMGRRFLANTFEKGKSSAYNDFPDEEEFLNAFFDGFVLPSEA